MRGVKSKFSVSGRGKRPRAREHSRSERMVLQESANFQQTLTVSLVRLRRIVQQVAADQYAGATYGLLHIAELRDQLRAIEERLRDSLDENRFHDLSGDLSGESRGTSSVLDELCLITESLGIYSAFSGNLSPGGLSLLQIKLDNVRGQMERHRKNGS